MNELFEAVKNEAIPMFDVAVITSEGTDYLKFDYCNSLNNSHSVTKLFIATAIGILHDRGLLDIDTPVTEFFDIDELPINLDNRWHKVTVKYALQHKSGLDTIPYGVDEESDIEKIGEDFLKYVFSLKIEHTPGSFYRYTDVNYYLLSRVIHKASGVTSDIFLRENIMKPLEFKQWAMVKCPMGHPIGGGGLFARADDVAKLGYVYANDGVYKGKKIISTEWIASAIENDFACTRFRNTDVFVKTGAANQMVAFSKERKAAVAWHGFVCDKGKRNDRLLEAFVDFLDKKGDKKC